MVKINTPSKEERHEIYKRALENALKEKWQGRGFCWFLTEACSEKYDAYSYMRECFPEIRNKRPEGYKGNPGYYFPISWTEDPIREGILREVIEETKPNN